MARQGPLHYARGASTRFRLGIALMVAASVCGVFFSSGMYMPNPLSCVDRLGSRVNRNKPGISFLCGVSTMGSHGGDDASTAVLEKESQPFVDAFGDCPKLKEVPEIFFWKHFHAFT